MPQPKPIPKGKNNLFGDSDDDAPAPKIIPRKPSAISKPMERKKTVVFGNDSDDSDGFDSKPKPTGPPPPIIPSKPAPQKLAPPPVMKPPPV